MKRREFITQLLPATGAVMIAPGFMTPGIMAEINQQFTGNEFTDGYDVVINGAGLCGYFAALEAAQKGLKVLVIDKRTSPGFDIAAKNKLWINTSEPGPLDNHLENLFFPEQEKNEISKKGGTGPNNSRFGDEFLLFSGSVRKGMLRNLLVNKIHVLLMTEVCGLFSDKVHVSGVLLASKHGLFQVNCKNFMDASDQLLFSRDLGGQNYRIKSAGFVLEIHKSPGTGYKKIQAPEDLGLLRNEIVLHPGKNADHQIFMEYEFPVSTQDVGEIEIKARLLSAEIGKRLYDMDSALKGAVIHNYALETSLKLEEVTLPPVHLDGHFLLDHDSDQLTCKTITAIRENAKNLVNKIGTGRKNHKTSSLKIVGAEIPSGLVFLSSPEEPGLSIPLKKCRLDESVSLSNFNTCGVLIGGGGTAGPMAGRGALEKGAETTVVDYFNDLGGTRTMGGVLGYYHGMKNNEFLKMMEKEASGFTSEMHAVNRVGRRVYLLHELIRRGGRFLPGSVICGASVTGRRVKGIMICRNGRLGMVSAGVTIDSTGDGDIAAFAGASFSHGNNRTGKTQNYSQWNITGGAKAPVNPNGDYDIIDNTKISELQRGLFLSHYEANFYDFYPYLTVRESRRINGLYELTLADAVEKTHFPDILSVATSDFDPHYVGNSEYTRCGFLLPHSNVVQVEIPYRCVVPAGLEGLLISGKAFSQTQNAMQFTRMAADLTVLGYLTGQVAARLTNGDIASGSIDISSLQQEWFSKGYIPQEYAGKKAGNFLDLPEEKQSRIKNLASGKREYLYDCCRLKAAEAVPLLKEYFEKTVATDGKLLLAKALAWFGESLGNTLLADELNELFIREQKEGYPGGYIENYDSIRGREKNVLEGMFWRINQNIALLAMSGNPANNEVIRKILDAASSGGKMFSWTGERGDYFNQRIDLRLVPFFNRIYNLCFYAERIPDRSFIPGFEKLMKDENIKGYHTGEYHLTRWKLYGADLEVYIGAAASRCGSGAGYHLLVEYLGDIHFNFRNYARTELESITGREFGFSPEKWKKFGAKLSFPVPVTRARREMEA